ncbi:MAG: hypothetical protein ABEH77_06680, partial [Halobacteriaceae archaeon]
MGRDRTRGPARRLRRLLVVVVLVTAAAGAGVASTSSFTLVDLDRPGTVDVVADSSGALALDTAGSVRAGTRQRLVTVGNDLGYDGVTVTVSLADGSDGTLYAGTEQGDSVTVTLDRGATSDVEVEASAGADSLQFDVTASAAGLSVSAPNRVVSVVGGVEVDVEFKGCSAVWLVITDGSPPFDATIRVDNGTTTDHDVTVNDGDTELVPGQHGDDA